MVWQQVVAGVVAALVPVVVKLITDWNRVALTRAGHPDIANEAQTTTAPSPPKPPNRSKSTAEPPTTPPSPKEPQ